MTTTHMNHCGLSGDERNSSRVLAAPGGASNMTGIFGSGDDKEGPRKQMSAGARRNYNSNVMATSNEDQENKMVPPQNQAPYEQVTQDTGRAKAIKPSDDSFGNLGFGPGAPMDQFHGRHRKAGGTNPITGKDLDGKDEVVYTAPVKQPPGGYSERPF